MFKKTITLILVAGIVLSLCSLSIMAADPPSDKSVYFNNGQAVNGTPAASGNNIRTIISGDVLKIYVTGKDDPNFGIPLSGNVDTATYKILALKVKKDYAGTAEGEIFYNVHGQGAVGGQSITFNYAEGTDYQWVYVDLSTKSAAQVGYIRYDVYGSSPVTGVTKVTLAAIGFFKSADDMNAFATSSTGQGLGTDEGNSETGFVSGVDNNPGIWLNTVQDQTKPGYYWLKFNANAPFDAIKFLLYASKDANKATGSWKLFKYDTNLEKTLASTPVATQTLAPAGDGDVIAEFDTMNPGQYLFYIESADKGDKYFCVALSTVDHDPKYFEVGFNGTNTVNPNTHESISATINFVGHADKYFNELITDGTSNPETGDIALIGYGFAAITTALLKKRKIK